MLAYADLFGALRSLELPLGHFAVFGSGPLIVREIIDATNDLDVISRGPAWERACVVGEVEFVEEYGLDIVHCSTTPSPSASHGATASSSSTT